MVWIPCQIRQVAESLREERLSRGTLPVGLREEYLSYLLEECLRKWVVLVTSHEGLQQHRCPGHEEGKDERS